MTNRAGGSRRGATRSDPWRGISIGLAVIFVAGLGLAIAMAIGQGQPNASTGPSPTISEPAPTPTSAESPSPVASASPSSEPSASVPASGAVPSPSGSAPATFTVRSLKVDATDDPEGRDRRLVFTTDEPATIKARVAKVTGSGTVDACLELNGAELYCTSGSTFTLTGQTSRSSGSWALTLRGQGAAAPELDITLEFPSAAPTVTIEGAWFDGASRPSNNGVLIELTPRAGPDVSIEASWTGSHLYRLTVQPPTGTDLVFEGTGSSVTEDVLLVPGTNSIVLVNTGEGANHVPLTVKIAWH